MGAENSLRVASSMSLAEELPNPLQGICPLAINNNNNDKDDDREYMQMWLRHSVRPFVCDAKLTDHRLRLATNSLGLDWVVLWIELNRSSWQIGRCAQFNDSRVIPGLIIIRIAMIWFRLCTKAKYIIYAELYLKRHSSDSCQNLVSVIHFKKHRFQIHSSCISISNIGVRVCPLVHNAYFNLHFDISSRVLRLASCSLYSISYREMLQLWFLISVCLLTCIYILALPKGDGVWFFFTPTFLVWGRPGFLFFDCVISYLRSFLLTWFVVMI